jgi:hypothetical protein
VHTTMHTELLHYFHVQEHETISKEKVMKQKQKVVLHKTGTNQAQHHGQFREDVKSKQVGQANKPGGFAKTNK